MTKENTAGTASAADNSDPLPSRRRVLALGAGLPLVAAPFSAGLFSPAPVRAEVTAPGGQMQIRAKAFLDSLDEEQRDAVSFDFDDRTRRSWNYMLGSAFAPGLPLERMQAKQKELALDLLSSGLSSEGMKTAENIMLQQDILRDEWGKGAPDRNRERFSAMIFGTPSSTGSWGWRWEGHHLSVSYTLIGEEIVSYTPTAFSSEPNTVPSGPHKGLVVLPDEESMGRRIYTDLSEHNRKHALLSDRSFGNIQTTAGNENRFADIREGVPMADLSQAQRDLVMRLVEVYSVDHLPAPLANAQRGRLREGDLMGARFGWAGADLDGNSIYYRLHGDTFLIEFATVRNQPLHHHTVCHDTERNLGDHRI